MEFFMVDNFIVFKLKTINTHERCYIKATDQEKLLSEKGFAQI